jgi:hypothetical protein
MGFGIKWVITSERARKGKVKLRHMRWYKEKTR